MNSISSDYTTKLVSPILYPKLPAPPGKVELISRTSLKSLRSYEEEIRDCTKGLKARKRRRTYYGYTTNTTIAILNEYPHEKGIGPYEPEFQKWHSVIKDHAYRRMQLFYYQLLFYFQENCRVTRGRTLSQHGRSKCPCCSAAHSAILPNLVDEKGLMKNDLHLYHNLNSTIEMPDIVNIFDCVIEMQMRPVALHLINLCAFNELHPYEALTIFAEKFAKFFALSKSESEYRTAMLERIDLLEKLIKELEEEEPVNPVDWTRKYVMAVYDLRESRIAFQKNKNFTLPISLDKYEPSRRQLFTDIWNSCPRFANNLQNIRTNKQLRRFLSKQVGLPTPRGRTLFKKKKYIMKYLAKTHPVELWLRSDKKVHTLYKKITDSLSSINPMQERSTITAKDKLRDTSIILELQEKGSICPPLEYLSGTKINGERVAFTIEQLLIQKKILQEVKRDDLN